MVAKQLKQLALFRLSAIGDVVMMVPVVRALARTFPQLDITWITSPLAYELLAGLSGVDFIIVDKPKSLSSWLKIRQQLQGLSYDVLLAAQASLRAHLIYPLIQAPRKIGFDAVRSRDGHGMFVNERIPFAREHLMDGFMRFAKVLGVTDDALEWRLAIDDEHYDWAQQQLSIRPGPWLAINPKASKSERDWSIAGFVEVIDQATRRWPVNIVLTGGSSAEEIALSRTIADKSNVDCLVLTAKTNLKQMAALLSRVAVLLAPDTGPVHIATAMKTPVVGLYAVAPATLSGPYFSQALVVDKYSQAVEQILNKDPSAVPWGQRVHSLAAMQLIEVDDVMQKLAVVLA